VTNSSAPRSRWFVLKYVPKRPMPEWRAVRAAELALVEQERQRRRQQNRYRLQVAASPTAVEWQLAKDDFAVYMHNARRAHLIGNRLRSRDVVRRRVGLMRDYPSWPWWKKLALLPFYNPIHTALDSYVLPRLVRDATTPIPPKRHYAQARHFPPRPKP